MIINTISPLTLNTIDHVALPGMQTNLWAQLTQQHSTGVTLKTHSVIHPKTNNKVKHFVKKSLKERCM